MVINRKKNASRNIVWGIFEKIAKILFPFITRTVLIKTLGAEYLGLNSLFTSVLQVLSISELGVGTAIVFSMYEPIAHDNEKKVCALLNLYRKIYYIIGLIILIVGLLVTPFLHYMIKDDYTITINIYLLFLIYLFDTVIGYFLYSYKISLFMAYQRNDIISKVSSLLALLCNTFQVLMLICFRNYYIFVLVIPIITILQNIIQAYLAKKHFPTIVCKGDISLDEKKELKKRIVGLLSFKIYGVIFDAVDAVVVSTFLGLTTLAIYNNYYYIQKAIISFLLVITSSITAGIGNKMVTNNCRDNYKDLINFSFVNGWICSWCAICLLCLYQTFMKIWMGEKLMFQFSTVLLIVIYFLIPRLTNLTYTYREAAGLWWQDRFRPLVSSIVNICANLILVKFIGINGVIISTILCTVFINVPWGTYILFKYYFKCSSKEYMMKIVFYILNTIWVGGLTLFVCSLIRLSDQLLEFVIKVGICCIIPNVLFWIVYRTTKEYINMKRFLSTIKK